jgi:flagellar biosynthesis/type III secretory pathway M-ring protein FliF/YscJ
MVQVQRKRHIGWWLLIAAVSIASAIAFAIMWRPALAPQTAQQSFDTTRMSPLAKMARLDD